MIKKIICLAVTVLISLTLISSKVSAEEVKVNTIMVGDKPYAPINIIVEKMGGKVQYNKNSRTTTYTIEDRSITLEIGNAYCVINGTFVPFEIKLIDGWVVPSFKPPVVKETNMYLPVDFLVKDVGLKLDFEGNQVAFEALEQPKTTHSSTLDPQPRATRPKIPTQQPIYTGSKVKQKLYGLGFVDSGSDIILNPNGARGGVIDTNLSFEVLGGDKDMSLGIFQTSPEIDQKIKTILNWILPSDGGRLYSVLDNPKLESQVLEMGGRTVTIRIESYGVMVVFSPIK